MSQSFNVSFFKYLEVRTWFIWEGRLMVVAFTWLVFKFILVQVNDRTKPPVPPRGNDHVGNRSSSHYSSSADEGPIYQNRVSVVPSHGGWKLLFACEKECVCTRVFVCLVHEVSAFSRSQTSEPGNFFFSIFVKVRSSLPPSDTLNWPLVVNKTSLS